MRQTYLIAGILCLGLALAGVFLPLLPATPFALLSGWLLSKSSPRLHEWVLSHWMIGPVIRDWNARGAIRPAAKSTATLMIGTSIAWIWVSGPDWLHWPLTVLLGGVLTFVLTRPNR